MSQAHTKHANALAALAFEINVPHEVIDVSVKKALQNSTTDLIPTNLIGEQDWRTSIIYNLI